MKKAASIHNKLKTSFLRKRIMLKKINTEAVGAINTTKTKLKKIKLETKPLGGNKIQNLFMNKLL